MGLDESFVLFFSDGLAFSVKVLYLLPYQIVFPVFLSPPGAATPNDMGVAFNVVPVLGLIA